MAALKMPWLYLALSLCMTTHLVAPCELTFSCPPEWVLIGTHCYLYVDKMLDFSDAQMTCPLYGATLVAFRDEVDAHDISLEASSHISSKSFWVANLREKTKITTPVSKDGYWQVNEPRTVDASKTAVSSNFDGRWRVENAEDFLPFVCSAPACPEDSFRCSNGRCINSSLACNGRSECDDGSDEIDCPGNCIHYKKGNTGSISLGPYSNDAHCRWTIEAEPGEILKLEFSVLELEDDVDVLTIYSGSASHEGANILDTITGNGVLNGPSVFYGVNNFMILELRSDSSVTKAGIQATWSTVPPISEVMAVTTDYQEVTGPPYMKYVWTLNAPPGERIIVEMTEKYNTDLVSVSNIGAEIEMPEEERFVWISEGDMIRIVVESDRDLNQLFKARVRTGCDVDLSTSYAEVKIDKMPKDVACQWKFTNPDGLQLKAFSSELSFGSNSNNYLKIYNSSGISVFTGTSDKDSSTPMDLAVGLDEMTVDYFTDAQLFDSPDIISFTVSSLCPEFQDISHMKRYNPVTYATLTYTVGVSCDRVYTFKQENYPAILEAECRPTGKWFFIDMSHTREPSCQVVYCGIPPAIENGFIKENGGTVEVGGTATYECASGFDMSGHDIVECNEDGSWSTPPSCVADNCAPFTAPSYSSISYVHGDANAGFGTVIEITCDSGYELVGSKYVVCLKTIEWSSTDTTCQILQCPLPEIEHGAIQVNALPSVGETVTFECDDGFQIPNTTSTTAALTCNSDREFYGILFCEDINECSGSGSPCEANEVCVNLIGTHACLCETGYEGDPCERVREYPYAHCTLTGNEATCICDDGFELFTTDGQNGYTISSSEDGDRENDVLHLSHTCIRKECSLPAIGSPNLEVVSNKTVHLFEDRVYYFCSPGFSLDGATSSQCQADGTFEDNVPTCTPITCDLPEESDLETNRIVKIFRNPSGGFQMKADGSLTITCTDQMTEKSRDKHLFCARDLDTDGDYTLQGDDPVCPEIDCGPVVFPGRDPAAITTNTTLGGEAEIKCDSSRGFTLHGKGPTSDKAICKSNGRWDYGTWVCQGTQCKDPGTKAGTIQHAPHGYEMDQVIYYTCIDPYLTLEPAGPLMCVYDKGVGAWNGTIPSCIDDTPPIITCSADTVNLDLYQTIPEIFVNASDNFNIVAVEHTAGPVPEHSVITQDTTVTYTAYDHSLPSECSIEFKVKDRSFSSPTCSPAEIEFNEADGVGYTTNISLSKLGFSGSSGIDMDSLSLEPNGILSVVPGQNIVVRASLTNPIGITTECGLIAKVKDLACSNETISNVINGRIENCRQDGSAYKCKVICNDGYILPTKESSIEASCENSKWNKEIAFYSCYETVPQTQSLNTKFLYTSSKEPIDADPLCQSAFTTSLVSKVNSVNVCGDYVFSYQFDSFHLASQTKGFFIMVLEVSRYDDNATALEECRAKLFNEKETFFQPPEVNIGIDCGFPWTLTEEKQNEVVILDPACDEGKQDVDVDGSTRCVSCLPGTYLDDGQCKVCDNGFYNPDVDQTTCQSCPFTGGNLIFNVVNTGVLTANGCSKMCPPGFISSSGLYEDTCKECPKNTYWTDSKTCAQCPNSGTTKGNSAAVNISACFDECPLGEYSITGYAPCTPCPVGFYNDETIQIMCKECPKDKTTENTGTVSSSDCADLLCRDDCDTDGTDSAKECIKYYHLTQCACKEGYYGDRCELVYDPCDPNPCYNNGICQRDGIDYLCLCPKDRDCEFITEQSIDYARRGTGVAVTSEDECQNNCLENNACKAYLYETGFVNYCYQYTTVHLTVEIENIHISKIKACNDTEVLAGKQCEEDLVDDCTENSCAERNFCHDLIGSTDCVCPTGAYQSPRCEKPSDACDAADCQNGAKCKAYGNVRYICECQPGYTGDSCETLIDVCETDTCLHGGTCVADEDLSYTCNCRNGYSGDNCEIIEDLCDSSCGEGAECQMDYFNEKAFCLCPDHFEWPDENTKDQCQRINYCDSSPCVNSTGCDDIDGDYICECQPGFEGKNCQHNINDCTDDSCQHEGVCHDRLLGVFCDCPPGYEGDRCETEIDDCRGQCHSGNTETCQDRMLDYECVCKDGYTGKNCSMEANLCDEAPCQHGGSCGTSFNDYTCTCLQGWTGKNCENMVDNCDDSTCQNDAPCINMNSGPFCRCLIGTAGDLCESKSDLCDMFGEFLCLNGTCEEEEGHAVCACHGEITSCSMQQTRSIDFSSETLPGVSREAVSAAECNQKCLDNEDCKAMIISSGLCYLYGAYTEEQVFEPFYETAGKKKCVFDPYFTGKSCELVKDHCADNPCGYDGALGQCKNDGLSYTCDCENVANMEGPMCKTQKEVCSPSPCPSDVDCFPYIDMHGMLKPTCLCPPSQVQAGDTCKDADSNFDLAFSEENENSDLVTSVQGFLTGDKEEFSIAFWIAATSEESGWFIRVVDDMGDPIIEIENSKIILHHNETTEEINLETPLSQDFEWHFFSLSLSSEGGYESIFDLTTDLFVSGDHDILNFRMPIDKLAFIHIGNSFKGYLSQLKVWKCVLETNDALAMLPNSLAIPSTDELALGWTMYSLSMVIRPVIPSSVALGRSVCLIPSSIATAATCPDLHTDTKPPKLVGECNKESIFNPETPGNQVSLGELNYNFDDGQLCTNFPGYAISLGAHDVAIGSKDDNGNIGVCMTRVYVTSNNCEDTMPSPTTTVDDTLVMVACPNSQVPSIPMPLYLLCGKLHSYNLDDMNGPVQNISCGLSEGLRVTVSASFKYTLGLSCNKFDLKDDLEEAVMANFPIINTDICPVCTDNTCSNIEIAAECLPSDTVNEMQVTIIMKDLTPTLECKDTVMRTPEEALEHFVDNDHLNAQAVSNAALVTDSLSAGSVKNCVHGYGRQEDLCVQCGPGTYYDQSTESCELCPVGEYSDSNEMTMCTPCPDGKTTLGQGSKSTLDCFDECNTGTFYDVSEQRCVDCPSNFYQNEKSQSYCKPCPPGTHSINPGSNALEDCQDVCKAGTQLVDRTCVICERGTYRDGSLQDNCKACPDQKFTTRDEGSSAEAQCDVPKCPPGNFVNQTENALECVKCDYGTYQPDKDVFECKPCAESHTTESEGSRRESDCIFTCPSGYQKVDNEDSCEYCPRGYYRGDSLEERFMNCSQCSDDAKTTSAVGATSSDDCTVARCHPGTYFDSDANSCHPCEVGTYQDEEQQPECHSCDESYTTENEGSDSLDQCIFVCPAGSQVDGTEDCELCPRGSYKTAQARFEKCANCTSGTTEEAGSTSSGDCNLAKCDPGHIVSPDNLSCKPCGVDTYQPIDSPLPATVCLECPIDTGTIGDAKTQKSDCKKICGPGEGLYKDVCTACPRGTWNDGGLDNRFQPCVDCPKNFTTDSSSGATSEDDCSIAACDAGYKVSGDKATCLKCPVDTYQLDTLPYSSTECTDCPENTGTKEEGANDEDLCEKFCEAGFGYDSGEDSCVICTKGTYNNGDLAMRFVECSSCPDNFTTSNDTGATSKGDCDLPDCDPGSHVNSARDGCEPCEYATYQPLRHQMSCEDCPANKNTSGTGDTDESACQVYCNSGFEDDGSDNCVPCQDDYFKDSAGFQECQKCSGDVTSSSGNRDTCDRTFCDVGRTETNGLCQNCKKGYFKDSRGNNDCSPCPGNTTTPTDGASAPADCSEIFCVPGFFSPDAATCIVCPMGTYKTDSGNEACTNCTDNNTTETVANTDPSGCYIPICPAGSYRIDRECHDCEIGSYQSSTGQLSCNPCSSGYTTVEIGSTSNTDCRRVCPSGQYRNDTTNTCMNCGHGLYSDNTEATVTVCTACPGNFTTSIDDATSVDNCAVVCPAGYSRSSSTECAACAIGTYNQDVTEQNLCEPCPLINELASSTQNEGSTSEEDCFLPCQQGNYLNKTARSCVECAVGSYKTSTGLQEECTVCPAGKSTLTTGSDKSSDCDQELCAKGYYRPLTENTCQSCGYGLYQPDDNSTANECLPCPDGKNTITKGNSDVSVCITDCEAGKEYDPEDENCKDCPLNSYKAAGKRPRCAFCPNGTITTSTGSAECNKVEEGTKPTCGADRSRNYNSKITFRFANCNDEQLDYYTIILLRFLKKQMKKLNKSLCGVCPDEDCSNVKLSITSCKSIQRKRDTDGDIEATITMENLGKSVIDNDDGLEYAADQAIHDGLSDPTGESGLEEFGIAVTSVSAVTSGCADGYSGGNCDPCAAGTYFENGACENVPKGSYTDTEAATSPILCPDGQTTARDQSNSSESCDGLCAFDFSYCQNSGVCQKNLLGVSTCYCGSDFEGDDCATFKPREADNDHTTMIAGIVGGIGGLLLVVLIIACICALMKKSKNSKSERSDSMSMNEAQGYYNSGSMYLPGATAPQPYYLNPYMLSMNGGEHFTPDHKVMIMRGGEAVEQ